MRQRVLETAQRLGYRPHRYAQILAKGRSGIIGVLQSSGILQINIQRTHHVLRLIRENGFHPLVADSTGYPAETETACQSLIDARVEGVLLQNASIGPSQIRQFQNAEIPVVALSGGELSHVPQVRADVCQGMLDLTNHLLALGYRRMRLLGLAGADGSGDLAWPTAERIKGFRTALTNAGLQYEDTDVQFSQRPADSMVPYRSGFDGMQRILQASPLPEAVLCSNDDLAIGALCAAAGAGRRVPEDIAVTGFDNSPMSEFTMVPLTTVMHQTERMVRQAMEMLMDLMRGKEIPEADRLVKVPCQLVVRRSCGANQ
ncbi:MAG: LacI family DNA-binding transcriptional regulator [Verrucomicrobia bacterium]|nr:LacI family DNA-binding transcriptional regulator [Verrucomicrobiota bacterium]